MVLQKEKIKLKIKVNVWLRDCYYNCIYLCQCKTCENLVYIPKSVSDSLKLKEITLSFNVNGVGEFGHIISEKNGGKVDENNLVIQCKSCNTSLGYKNMIIPTIDKIMLDIETLNTDLKDVEMEDISIVKIYCSKMIVNRRCRNFVKKNRNLCHVHLNN